MSVARARLDELRAHCRNTQTGSALRVDKEELLTLIDEIIQCRLQLVEQLKVDARRLRSIRYNTFSKKRKKT